MIQRALSSLRGAAIAGALASPVVSGVALRFGVGVRFALALASVQAVAAGLLLWTIVPERWRALAVAAAATLLAGLAAGASHSARDGLLAVTGLGHALFYATLLAIFGLSLRPGRVSVVTGLAMRLNPRFRPGMVPYTRAVTATWCGFFAGQLALSAGLLALAPLGWWLLWVSTLHGPMAAGLGAAEFAIRRWRFPGQHTGLRETISGIRSPALRDGAWRESVGTAVRASRPGEDCLGRSGNATRLPPRDEDSVPGPAE